MVEGDERLIAEHAVTQHRKYPQRDYLLWTICIYNSISICKSGNETFRMQVVADILKVQSWSLHNNSLPVVSWR